MTRAYLHERPIHTSCYVPKFKWSVNARAKIQSICSSQVNLHVLQCPKVEKVLPSYEKGRNPETGQRPEHASICTKIHKSCNALDWNISWHREPKAWALTRAKRSNMPFTGQVRDYSLHAEIYTSRKEAPSRGKRLEPHRGPETRAYFHLSNSKGKVAERTFILPAASSKSSSKPS